jgi:hypothetical protein
VYVSACVCTVFLKKKNSVYVYISDFGQS